MPLDHPAIADGFNCPYILPVKSEFKWLFFRRFSVLSKRIYKKNKKKRLVKRINYQKLISINLKYQVISKDNLKTFQL